MSLSMHDRRPSAHPGARKAARRLLLLAALSPVTARVRAVEEYPPTAEATQLKRMSVEELLAQDVVSVSRKPEAPADAASSVFLLPGQSATTTGATTLPELPRMAANLFVDWDVNSWWRLRAGGFVIPRSAERWIDARSSAAWSPRSG